jgi:hypothetical protein
MYSLFWAILSSLHETDQDVRAFFVLMSWSDYESSLPFSHGWL